MDNIATPTVQTIIMGTSFSKGEQSSSESDRDARLAIPTDEKIMDNILENLGKTPLVRLNRIPKSEGLECEGESLSCAFKPSIFMTKWH